jgi:ABC-type glycerol-3-phosphate transport system substrate-binding protein
MKLHALRSISALALAALLAACGGGAVDQPTTMTAAAVMSSSSAQVTAQVSAAMPAPDCAADGCKSLRVIDANAEAYRYDAMRRAAAEDAAGATNS